MSDPVVNTEHSAVPAASSVPAEINWAANGNGVGFGAGEGEGEGKHARLFKVAEERRQEVTEFLRRAGEGHTLDVDYVHDLRVALRRLSEVAGLLTVLMDKGSARAVQESLKGLRKAAGDLRDMDVMGEHLRKWRMPGALKKRARGIVEAQEKRRGELEQALRLAATSASVAGTMVLLARVLEESSKPEAMFTAGAKLRRELEKRIAQRRKKLKRDFGRAAKKQKAEILHEARIAAKKLRYVVELEKELNEKGNKRELKFLKGVQQLLGDHHDVHVIEAALEKEVMGAKPLVRGLRGAWRKWRRESERKQAERAAEFFMRTYAWMNAG
ncbi:MAG TPA: CHAD domain-containing protein [Phycisphaerae bacterium]|nr:CHAD domain-containing protein [Phycisphaerae bacterium]